MEVDPIKDALDRVGEIQKISASKVHGLIDHFLNEIERSKKKLEESGDNNHARAVIAELQNRLNGVNLESLLEGSHKDLNITVAKTLKLLEKSFVPDISKAYRNVLWDTRTINETIASHLYRNGLFDVGDCFTHEAGQPDLLSLKYHFQEMYSILEAMKKGDLEPVLAWAARNRHQLTQNGSTLELKLHQCQFFSILNRGSGNESLNYARTYLAPFAYAHKDEIPKLMGHLLWAGRLDKSPYADLMPSTHLGNLAQDFVQQFCSLVGQSCDSPLSITASAGFQALPTLLKLSHVMAARPEEWQGMKQLPVPLDLGPEFQFHSMFVCPVLREPAGDENPPMLMPCGHVASHQSIVKLTKNSVRSFKCPYCPSEATLSQCRQLHI